MHHDKTSLDIALAKRKNNVFQIKMSKDTLGRKQTCFR